MEQEKKRIILGESVIGIISLANPCAALDEKSRPSRLDARLAFCLIEKIVQKQNPAIVHTLQWYYNK